MKKDEKTFLDYLSDMGAWVLGGAMFIYLGFRTLDFLTFTFREEDVLFAYLGLFSTTVGAIIFALIYKRSFYFDRKAQVWRSDEFRKTAALVMMVVCAGGELLLAVADMSVVTAQKSGVVTMTEGELNTFMWLTAGLAGAVGVAIGAIKLTPRHPKTDPILDMSEFDADNNGVEDSKEQPAPINPAPMNTNASEMELVALRKKVAEYEAKDPKQPADK